MPLQRTHRPPERAPVTTQVLRRQKETEHPLVIIPAEDAKILQAVAAGDYPENAVLDAFPEMTRVNARTYATNITKRYNDMMIQALERQGVNIDTVAEKISEQMTAMTPLVYKGERTGDEVVDGAARRWAVDTVLDILPGARAPKQLEVKKTSLEAIVFKIQQEGGDD